MRNPSKEDSSWASLKLLELELDAVKALAKSLDSPRSLTVSLLIENQEWKQLLDLVANPKHYRECDLQRFADDYLVTEILKKDPRIPLGVNRANEATKKWIQAERRNRETNALFEKINDGRESVPSDTLKFLHVVRSWVSRIVGPLDSRSLKRIEWGMRFGKGSTSHVSGDVRKSRKYSGRTYGCTPDLLYFRMFGFPQMWKRHVHTLEIVYGSEYMTVSKNAQIDRPICVEPDLNIYVQLGIGTYLKSRLRLFGLDLSDQERNRMLAKLAYRLGLTTMDLSSASDLIAHEVVKFLTPRRWFELLCFARCDLTKVRGQWVRLGKFSSMGNGYTFELETIIFYAMLLACEGRDPENDSGYVSSDVGVYGDDLIFPSHLTEKVSSALDLLGFRVNKEKTFGEGLFYESCGKDYFCGVDVRPFYIRVDEEYEDADFEEACYLTANAACHYAGRLSDGQYRDIRILPFWLRYFTAVKPRSRHRIPKGFGDNRGFIADRYELPDGPRSPWGSRVRYRMRETVRRFDLSSGDSGYVATMAENLSGLSQCSPSLHPQDGGENMRKVFKRPVTKSGHSKEWPQLGPWL